MTNPPNLSEKMPIQNAESATENPLTKLLKHCQSESWFHTMLIRQGSNLQNGEMPQAVRHHQTSAQTRPVLPDNLAQKCFITGDQKVLLYPQPTLAAVKPNPATPLA